MVSLILSSEDYEELPSWKPGAHVEVKLPGYTRHYSLCGKTGDRSTYRLGILREAAGHGGSAYIHDNLHVGTELIVGPPKNQFALMPAPEYLFIAGGIGITPILPMIDQVEQEGRRWRLVYGGRTRSSMAFLDEVAGHGHKVTIAPQDEAGLLDLASVLRAPCDAKIYCCGPAPLLEAVESASAHWPEGSLVVERFGARAGNPDADHAFDVDCIESGITVHVAEDQSMLDALSDAGIDTNYDCRGGTCGSCELDLLEGLADHRDVIQSAAEREEGALIFPCVSRALGARLVVDI